MEAPFRLEYKYLVPDYLRDTIRDEIRPFVEFDPFARDRAEHEYTVRSIYFDTRHMACYCEKIEGLKTRKKFRIRGYDRPANDNIVFLEIKRKQVNYIAKNRAALRWKDVPSVLSSHTPERYILADDSNGDSLNNAARFLYNFHRFALGSTILIVYEREAFQGVFDHALRITFDKNIRSNPFPSLEDLFSDEPLRSALPGYFIMEVKFAGGLPQWIMSLIERYQLPRLALSKYAICLDSHGRCSSAHLRSFDDSTTGRAVNMTNPRGARYV
ncbi:MAG TPA: polyphosphate polymerase domain-containing protein [candidate division Zixibacteria bacterium]|nr:polyphosphate polymerase domain-containing protein [candidate division Zixibacteria bacterium]